MNRRNFLRNGSLAMVAIAGLPKASRASANVQTSGKTYRSKPEQGKDGQWLYEITIDHSVIENFADAKPLDKNLLLKMAYFSGSDFKTPTQQGDCYYVISKVKASKEAVPEWEITVKLDKNISSDNKLDNDFPKTPKLYTKKEQYVSIRGKKGEEFKHLDYVPPVSSSSSGTSGGCFLTTACVEHKQLADDCEALQTLRSLRDNFMKKDEGGNELIGQYQLIGPAIVNAINSCDNKAEIYDYMYNRMILPSVDLVKQGRQAEAVEYYKNFVKALMKQYN